MKNLKYLAFIFVLAITNCESFRSVLQEPVLSLNSVELAKINLTGVEMIAHLDVENHNGFSIPLPKIEWGLFINDASFIQGVINSGGKSLKSRAKTTVDIPVSVTYDGLYRSVSSLIETKQAAYKIALGVSFPIPIIESKVFRKDFAGIIPLPQLPKLSPAQVKFSKIDFSGVELSCGINVENPNGFPIPFPEINWNYEVSGVPVIRSSFAGSGEIAAGAASVALITVGVAYADIFKAVDSARNAGEVKTNLSLETSLPIPFLKEKAAAQSSESKPEPKSEGTDGNDGVKSWLDIPGTLPILQMPEISFQGIAKKSLGTTMEFYLNWEVNNKSNMEFTIEEFNYNFKVNNNLWAQGIMNNPPKIKASGKTVISITASISAVSIVRELVDVINRGTTVAYNCTGNMALLSNVPGVSKLELPLNLSGNSRIQ